MSYHNLPVVSNMPYTTIIIKSHQRANSILGCFVSGNISLIVRGFAVYVRPTV